MIWTKNGVGEGGLLEKTQRIMHKYYLLTVCEGHVSKEILIVIFIFVAVMLVKRIQILWRSKIVVKVEKARTESSHAFARIPVVIPTCSLAFAKSTTTVCWKKWIATVYLYSMRSKKVDKPITSFSLRLNIIIIYLKMFKNEPKIFDNTRCQHEVSSLRCKYNLEYLVTTSF